jgi:hypothetical protein
MRSALEHRSVDTRLVLKLPPFETVGANARLVESRDQLRIEQRLYTVGRGRLLVSSQTTREEWVDALHELNSRNVDKIPRVQRQLPVQRAPTEPNRCVQVLTNSI